MVCTVRYYGRRQCRLRSDSADSQLTLVYANRICHKIVLFIRGDSLNVKNRLRYANTIIRGTYKQKKAWVNIRICVIMLLLHFDYFYFIRLPTLLNGQRIPRSECANAHSDLEIPCPHMPLYAVRSLVDQLSV